MNGYVGPAVWIRLKHRFGPRKLEWFLAWLTFGMGLDLLLYPEIFEGKHWILFKSIMPPLAWGGFMTANGAICLIGLFVNGARKEITPWIRTVCAVLRAFTWAGMSLAFYFSGHPGLWIVIFPSSFVAEWFNLWSAARDSGESYASKNTGYIKPAG